MYDWGLPSSEKNLIFYNWFCFLTFYIFMYLSLSKDNLSFMIEIYK